MWLLVAAFLLMAIALVTGRALHGAASSRPERAGAEGGGFEDIFRGGNEPPFEDISGDATRTIDPAGRPRLESDRERLRSPRLALEARRVPGGEDA